MKEAGFIGSAWILLTSHYHNYLRCKVVDPHTSQLLSCTLINTKSQTMVNINRNIEDFIFKLVNDSITVGVFVFNSHDLNFQESDKQVTIRKESDECGVRLKFMKEGQKVGFKTLEEGKIEYEYEDHYRILAQNIYEKMEKSALKSIQKTFLNRKQNKRFSQNVQIPSLPIKTKAQFMNTWTNINTDFLKSPKMSVSKRPKKRKNTENGLSQANLQGKSDDRRKKIGRQGLIGKMYAQMMKTSVSTKWKTRKKNSKPKNIEVLCHRILPKYWQCQERTKTLQNEFRGSQFISYQPTFTIRSSLRSTIFNDSQVQKKAGKPRRHLNIEKIKINHKKYQRFASQEKQQIRQIW